MITSTRIAICVAKVWQVWVSLLHATFAQKKIRPQCNSRVHQFCYRHLFYLVEPSFDAFKIWVREWTLYVWGRDEWECRFDQVCTQTESKNNMGGVMCGGRHQHNDASGPYKPCRIVSSMNFSRVMFPTVTSDGRITFLAWITAVAGSLRRTATSPLGPNCIPKVRTRGWWDGFVCDHDKSVEQNVVTNNEYPCQLWRDVANKHEMPIRLDLPKGRHLVL